MSASKVEPSVKPGRLSFNVGKVSLLVWFRVKANFVLSVSPLFKTLPALFAIMFFIFIDAVQGAFEHGSLPLFVGNT